MLGDVNNDGRTDWKEISVPSVNAPCFSPSGYDVCYIPATFGHYNTTITDAYNLKIENY